jgi:sugar phosphate isomerase/epimerase
MTQISLNSSSFVGRQCGYGPQSTWDACVDAVNAYYRPEDTFAARFEKMLLEVKQMGFDALDIWTAGQMNWAWTTEMQMAWARELLARHNLTVTSLGAAFGSTREEFVSACKLAAGVNTKLLSGTLPLLEKDRAFVVDSLHKYDLYLGWENHPEKSAQEVLDIVGDSAGGRIGTTIDTGWYGTQSGNVVREIKALRGHIFQVHLKDVLSEPSDQNVGWGDGIVPMQECVQTLQAIGYDGLYSVEIHSIDHDPTSELEAAGQLLRGWIGMSTDIAPL